MLLPLKSESMANIIQNHNIFKKTAKIIEKRLSYNKKVDVVVGHQNCGEIKYP